MYVYTLIKLKYIHSKKNLLFCKYKYMPLLICILRGISGLRNMALNLWDFVLNIWMEFCDSLNQYTRQRWTHAYFDLKDVPTSGSSIV